MLSLTRAFARLSTSTVSRAVPAPLVLGTSTSTTSTALVGTSRRYAGEIVHPRKVRFRKAHKGRISLPLGGSVSGSTLQFGEYGLALKEGGRLTAAQLESARRLIRRKIRAAKGCEMWLRVFPDIPVTSKGNETRMGKGKGTFEYYACRVPMGRVVFEIGGGGLRWELAKDALRQAGLRLPVETTIITRKLEGLQKTNYEAATTTPASPQVTVDAATPVSSSTSTPSSPPSSSSSPLQQ
ncbi:ribosomal protein L10e/L16 [Blastocladiella britannica]|nr:ribosomal protein L10e/L16 [Blastocladiella britannica]